MSICQNATFQLRYHRGKYLYFSGRQGVRLNRKHGARIGILGRISPGCSLVSNDKIYQIERRQACQTVRARCVRGRLSCACASKMADSKPDTSANSSTGIWFGRLTHCYAQSRPHSIVYNQYQQYSGSFLGCKGNFRQYVLKIRQI